MGTKASWRTMGALGGRATTAGVTKLPPICVYVYMYMGVGLNKVEVGVVYGIEGV
jgi:hypothetical protein